MKRVFNLLILVLVSWSCTPPTESLPYFNTADFTPQWISKNTGEYYAIHTVPAFSFYDQDGKVITEKTIQGKIVVADFFFTVCPGICPRLTKSMGVIQKTFENDSSLMLLSHSVTPDIDSIPRLHDYATSHNVISGKWHLLTGNRSDIYAIARKGYFADEEVGLTKGDDEFLHTENFILLDSQRRIRGVYNGTNPAEVERLVEDIHALQKEMQHENS